MLDQNTISLETVNVKQIIQIVLNNLSHEIKTTKAEIAILESIPKTIQADPQKVQEIFQLLISIGLESTAKDRNPVIIISGDLTTTEFIFHIEDNGLEIQEQRKQLSDRLLSNCSKLVELHNGKIWVKSTQKEGNLYTFSIPK